MASAANKGRGGGGKAAGKFCDSCGASPAVLYCRADAAFLCGACDGRVHGANGLASRHERAWLCEVCESAPAAVACKADAAALCVACDADIHAANPLARRHHRVPLPPFVGPAPASASATASSLQEDASTGYSLLHQEAQPPPRFFFSDSDAYLDLDYGDEPKAAVDEEAGPAACLQSPTGVVGGCLDLNATGSEPDLSFCPSDQSSEAAVVPEVSQAATAGGFPDIPSHNNWDPAAARADREARLMRYREKRKSRRFEKTIRYASRKAYAEARPRMKGRFVKRTEAGAEAEIYSAAAAILMADDDYGVVPSY